MLIRETRSTAPATAGDGAAPRTFSGHRGLDHEEKPIFEIGRADVSGTDWPDVALASDRLGGLERHAPIGLPGLSEPETVRHYVRLSQKNASIDGSTKSLRGFPASPTSIPCSRGNPCRARWP
jgi:glycine dehydrogenase subunit 2